MAFWNSLPEPHRQFRWYIDFKSSYLKGYRYALKKAARPTIKVSEIKHKYLNHEYYFPGRVEWEQITISFAAAPDAEEESGEYKFIDAQLIDMLKKSGYIYPSAPNAPNVPNAPNAAGAAGAASNISTISKAKAVGTLTNVNGEPVSAGKPAKTISLTQIDADGETLETWYLFNPFFTEVKFDSLDYGSEEILTLECTIKYDWASQTESGGVLV